MSDNNHLDEIVAQVCAGARYRAISPALARRIATQELAKGRSFKETVKAVRNKLHQVGGAYQEEGIDYARWMDELESLPPDLHAPETLDFCRRVMQQHASTNERLPILEQFFTETLSHLPPIRSVLDLASGLTPLSLPWMPLASGASYIACDIYSDLADFLDRFFDHFDIHGEANLCDLTQSCPGGRVDLALLLKTIPCLEQVDKTAGVRLLEQIQAEHILVSFPARSLGGRKKGMVQNYEAHFKELILGKPWTLTRFEFSSELAFLIKK
jgi:16S rRNA (guanine(1405)-N(7))-methyltransferase